MNSLVPVGPSPDALLLDLDGFAGPLDLLLDLARREKVDLNRISIGRVVDQFLAAVDGHRRVRLELAADWLVMASWLAWLKSRLLLPGDPEADAEAEDAADALAARLRALEELRAAAAFLEARPRLGRDTHRRGAGEEFRVVDRSGFRVDLPSLLAAYLAAGRRARAAERWTPARHAFPTVADAIARLARLLGTSRDWRDLAGLLLPPDPPAEASPLARAAAIASALLAGLELARAGSCELRQDAPFAPVLLRAAGGA